MELPVWIIAVSIAITSVTMTVLMVTGAWLYYKMFGKMFKQMVKEFNQDKAEA